MSASVPIAIYSLLSGNSTLLTALGGTSGDKRIYRNAPPKDVELNSTTPGYIILSTPSVTTIGNSNYGEDELWQARCVAKDPDTLDTIKDQVRELVTELHEFGEISVTSRVHLGGGKPSHGPDGYIKELDAHAVNVRFSVMSITTT